MKTSINQQILIQVSFWAVLFIGLPYLVSGGNMIEIQFIRGIILTSSVAIMIWLNLKYLFPKFYQQRSFRTYILVTLLVIVVVRFLSVTLAELGGLELISGLDEPSERFPFRDFPTSKRMAIHIVGGSVPLFIATIISTLYQTSIVATQSAKEAAQLKSEKLEAELKFLKSQINPHFLFNSLNNIYTLTVIDPNLAGKSLLKLSEMLRYLLYECDAEKVALGRELTYLQNYIDLFSLKDEESLNIIFDAKDVQADVMIAPLLFIPFVENAFKHSQIEDLENGWIKITMLGDAEKLYFEIKNSVPKVEFAKDEVGGIGLQNVKRQLELLYPHRHQLKVERENGHFGVYLTIKLR